MHTLRDTHHTQNVVYNTMKGIFKILLILISTLGYSQSKPEFEVFREVIGREISSGGLYIQCAKPKTFFDPRDFTNQTGLDVPSNILIEIEKNTNESNDGFWKSKLINELKYGSDFIKSKKCLSHKDVERLLKKTGERQSVVSISEPIFDINYENCVVSVTYWKYTGSAYGYSYFLKKVYGVWTIIITYEPWIT